MQQQGPPPSLPIIQLISAEWASVCLKATVLLGVPDALKDGPKTPQQLGEALKVNGESLQRVLRVLTSYGIFKEEGDAYANNESSSILVSGDRTNMRAMVRMLGHESHTKPWAPEELVYSITTGKESFPHFFAEHHDFWGYMDSKPDQRPVFWEAMESTSSIFHAAIPSVYDFSQVKQLVDVGGGYGTLLRNIMKKFPHLHGILFDLPHVIEKATIKEEAELQDRLQLVGGSFFETVPTAEYYVSTTVLHDWNDEKASQILAAIHKAAPPGAKLLLGETVVPETPEQRFSKLMDVHMMVMIDGKERTAKQWEQLLAKNGFKLLRIIPTVPAMDFCIVEADRL